jgi:hypothetical protein
MPGCHGADAVCLGLCLGAADPQRGPVGFMDMGGGSAQLVFALDSEAYRPLARPLPLFNDDIIADRESSSSSGGGGGGGAAAAADGWHVYELDLSFEARTPRPVRVYGVSHLGYGVNAARRRYEEGLQAGGASTDPCRHEGA